MSQRFHEISQSFPKIIDTSQSQPKNDDSYFREIAKFKTIPPELRKVKIAYREESPGYKRFILRLRHDPQFLRSSVQLAFVLLCIWIGFEFHLFMKWGLSGGTQPYINRPPGVDGFLPISSLLGVLHLIQTGVINNIHPSGIVILLSFSVVIKNFWCRYLCPYGALLGALSWLSPVKITRNNTTCIDCELCSRACPSDIKVHTATRVHSDECMSCLSCVAACLVKNTLEMKASITKTRIPNTVFAALIVGIFIAVTGFAMLTGNWKNGISTDEYLRHFDMIHTPVYDH
jgi:NAD-dependent dihydropyrimidine dehydrogenase PreA subunit